jgi:hypothetical protein
MKKFSLAFLLLSLISACTTPVSPVKVNSDVQTKNEIKDNNVLAQKDLQKNIIEVSKNQGASFNVTFDFNEGKPFTVKAPPENIDGVPAKTGTDIKSLKVYLVESATGYASGGDPIGDKIAAGPFDLDRTGTSAYTVTFSKVPPNTSTKSYYVAVRAFDNTGGTGNELIKDNNGGTAWTGTTASTPKVAVSTTGVSVNSSFVVSDPTAIPVTLNLLDAVGATLKSSVTPNAGSNSLPFSSVTAS